MNKLLAIAALTLLSVGLYSANTVNYQVKFEQYTTKYNKNYTPTERAYRLSIYESNLRMIEAHNADPTQTYTMGENQFTDLTQEEFVGIYLTLKPRSEQGAEEYIPNKAADPVVDWSNLTKVKDQGQCGSCWAFSAIGAIESAFRVKRVKTDDDLSEQQLVDCEKNSYGCDGGWPYSAINWAAKNGLVTGAEYPYAAVDQTCAKKTGTHKPAGYKTVKANNLQAAISDYPVSVCVDATNWSPYREGVFNNCKKSINHAVLAVGYYADGTWLIKNSWGTTWGEGGFIRLAAGDTCAVTQEAVIATV